MLKRDVFLLNFQDARIFSERNHKSLYQKDNKKMLSLNPKELQDLKEFELKNVDLLTIDEKIYFQKLFILNNLYKNINEGASFAEFILPFPLIPTVKDWVSAKGYCMAPTPVDYSYSYIDENGFWKYYIAKSLNPSTVCNYRILW